jgi:hypothetical protein
MNRYIIILILATFSGTLNFLYGQSQKELLNELFESPCKDCNSELIDFGFRFDTTKISFTMCQKNNKYTSGLFLLKEISDNPYGIFLIYKEFFVIYLWNQEILKREEYVDGIVHIRVFNKKNFTPYCSILTRKYIYFPSLENDSIIAYSNLVSFYEIDHSILKRRRVSVKVPRDFDLMDQKLDEMLNWLEEIVNEKVEAYSETWVKVDFPSTSRLLNIFSSEFFE